MTKINSNIDELKKIINEPNFKLEEANEFLEAIENDADKIQEEVLDLKSEVSEKEGEIAELENPDNFDAPCDSTIKCGIGEINYETPDNILLQELMENLDKAVQKNTAKKVSEILSSIV